jgi:hypothetical protein
LLPPTLLALVSSNGLRFSKAWKKYVSGSTLNFSLITLKDSHHSFGANKLMEMIMNDVNKKDLQ